MIGRLTSKRGFQRDGCFHPDDKEWKTKHKHAILFAEVPLPFVLKIKNSVVTSCGLLLNE
jgi:hypothetical protein